MAPATLFGAAAVDLYQAAVAVSGQGVQERDKAIGEALRKVLVRVTGSARLGAGPEARALAGEAAALVQQYRYETTSPTTDGGGSQTLVVRFDPAALQAALRDRGLPIWGEPRPSVLVWLGLDDQGGRRFLQAERYPELLQALERVSAERGIPLLLPLMDMEDLGRLRAADLWGGFEEPVRQASDRYAADLILVGRLSGAGGDLWNGGWELLYTDRSDSWRGRAATPAEAAGQAMREAADRIAARYAPALAGQASSSRLLVRVDGVSDLQGYFRVETLFRSLDSVEQVDVARVEPDWVLFRIAVRGGGDALRVGASLGRVLTPQPLSGGPPGPGAPPSMTPDLSFRLMR
jgi:hypothetical protein